MSGIYARFAWLTGQSLSAYIVRGGLGLGLLVIGFTQLAAHPYLALSLILLALVPLGGCPTCWLSGMIGATCAYRPRQDLPPR